MTQTPDNSAESQHLRMLYDLTRMMNSSLDFDQVLDFVMNSMMTITRAQRGFLMLTDENDQLQVRVARGMDEDKLEEARPYSTTIVNQVVATRRSLLTNNAQYDDRYEPGQSIIMRGLRAILCAPMLNKDRLVGVVYVDTAIRAGNFVQADQELLDAVASQAAVALENARLYKVAIEMGRLEHELDLAREIQESLLPRRMPTFAGYDLAATWLSAREVAGDFYDSFVLENGSLGMVIADVSDKGAPAALFMASSRSMIRAHAFSGMSPMDVMDSTNRLILFDTGNGMFVTVYYSAFYAGGASLHINAGHNPPLLYRHVGKQTQFMPRGGRALGWFADNPFKPVELQVQPGDILVYYTDGLTEAENAARDYFGDARLSQAVIEAAARPAQEIVDHIINQVNAFCDGILPFDDLTLCVVKYTG